MKEKLSPALHRVTLRQLRALAAVVDAGTITRAAEALHVTAPAVTQQLQKLEAYAGMPLFERTPDGIRATEAGDEILSTAARIENALGQCAEALELVGGITHGRVAVGLVSTAKYFAPRVLADFLKTHPDVDIRVRFGNRAEIMTALRDFDLDFAVTGRPPKEFETNSVVIGDHPHIVIAAPDHPLASRKRLPFSALAGERFLLREQGSGTRLLMRRLFAGAGLNPDLGLELGGNETIKQAVMAGLGIALISAHTVTAELAEARLVALRVTGLPVVRQWFIVRQQSKRLLPVARELWDFFAVSGARFLPEVPS
jgi:LysR family transcriptional regulator, low CO2-responsive transcriptional regulator